MSRASRRRGPVIALATLALVCALAAGADADDSSRKARKLRHRATAALAGGNYARAATLLERAIRADPDQPRLRRELAKTLARGGRGGEAIAAYRRYLEEAPRDDEATLALAQLLANEDTAAAHEEAARLLAAHLAEHPDDSRREAIALEWADVVAANGEVSGLREAIARYDEHLDANPGALEVRERRDQAALALAGALALSDDKGDLTEAAGLCDGYLAHHDDAAVMRRRGQILLRLGDPRDAAADLQAYIRDELAGAELDLADAQRASGEYGAAIATYDRYLVYHPRDLDARFRRAQSLRDSGQSDRAETELASLRRAAGSTAHRNMIDLELARLFGDSGRPYLAMDRLDAVIGRDPDNAAAWLERDHLASDLRSTTRSRLFLYDDFRDKRVSVFRLDVRAMFNSHASMLADVEGWSAPLDGERFRSGRANAGLWWRRGSLELEALGGPRVYAARTPTWGGRASARLVPRRWMNLRLSYEFDSIGYDMLQPAVLVAGVQGHLAMLQTYAEPVARVALYAQVAGRAVEDGNRMVDAFGFVNFKLLGPIRIGYQGQYQSWKFYAPLYWSPQFSVNHFGLLRFAGNIPHTRLNLEAQGLAGITGAGVDGVFATNYVRAYAASASLRYRRGQVEVVADAAYEYNERSGPSSVRGSLAIAFRF